MLKKCCLTLILYTMTLYASQSSLEKLTPTLMSILENDHYCILTIDDNQIYINPENIFPTKQGIFINLNGFDHILAPPLFSNTNGCYIDAKLCPSWVKLLSTRRCHSCNRPMDDYCTNLGCPMFGINIPR